MRPLLLLAVVVLVGCGSGAGRTADRTATPAATATPTPSPDPAAEDRRELRRLAARYAQAYSRADWTGVCATLAPRVRRRFTRDAGSCEAAYRGTATRAARRVSRSLTANRVRIRGDAATLGMGPSGSSEVYTRYYGVRVGDRWRITLERFAG